MRKSILPVVLAVALCAACPSPSAAAPPERSPGALRVVSYHVRGDSPAKKIAEDLERYAPDVVLLQEVDCKTRRFGRKSEVQALAKELGMFDFCARSAAAADDTTGQAILSRFPLRQPAAIGLPGGRNFAATSTIRWRGRTVRLLSVRFSTGDKTGLPRERAAAQRLREARHILSIIDQQKEDVIIGGDLGGPPGSEPHRILAAACTAVGPDAATFPADAPALRPDHVFVSGRLAGKGAWAGARGVSEHLPVVVDVVRAKVPIARPAGPQRLRVLTWNILRGKSQGINKSEWPNRRPVLEACLREAKPDIFCAQEVFAGQLAALRRLFPNHDVVARGRADGKSAGEHCAILYDRRLFELVANGTFWLSDTPDEPSRTWGDRRRRICTWVHLRSRQSGRELRVYNTHLPLLRGPRTKSVAVLLRHIEAESPLPTLLMGDFNERLGPGRWPELARAGLTDCFDRAKKRTGRMTLRLTERGIARIDWILASPEWHVRELRTLDRREDGVHPSDHKGVLTVLDLPAHPPPKEVPK